MLRIILILIISFFILFPKSIENFRGIPFDEMRKMYFCRYNPGDPGCQPLNRNTLSNAKPRSIGYLTKDGKIIPIYNQYDYSNREFRYLVRLEQGDWAGFKEIKMNSEPYTGMTIQWEGQEYTFEETANLLGSDFPLGQVIWKDNHHYKEPVIQPQFNPDVRPRPINVMVKKEEPVKVVEQKSETKWFPFVLLAIMPLLMKFS